MRRLFMKDWKELMVRARLLASPCAPLAGTWGSPPPSACCTR